MTSCATFSLSVRELSQRCTTLFSACLAPRFGAGLAAPERAAAASSAKPVARTFRTLSGLSLGLALGSGSLLRAGRPFQDKQPADRAPQLWNLTRVFSDH